MRGRAVLCRGLAIGPDIRKCRSCSEPEPTSANVLGVMRRESYFSCLERYTKAFFPGPNFAVCYLFIEEAWKKGSLCACVVC